ncbi:hypothetical protein LXL04_001196 [Taraxacum kok-saghyz]
MCKYHDDHKEISNQPRMILSFMDNKSQGARRLLWLNLAKPSLQRAGASGTRARVTWCQSEGRIGITRDWIIKDYSNCEVIGRATSKWFMMNEDTRRLQNSTMMLERVFNFLSQYIKVCLFILAFPEQNNSSLKK